MTKILDCTLRDGGHVNNWKFSDECIIASLKAAELAGVEYFEVGYSFPECLNSVYENTNLVIMRNASGQLLFDYGKAEYIRVAAYPDEIKKAISDCEFYLSRDLNVFLHLMTADKLEEKHYKILSGWENKNILTSLYFADSFGTFTPNTVESIFENLKGCGFEKISFHAHNNLQLAFANTLKAIELGAYSVDGSIYGIGRGAGNLPVELLAWALGKNNKPYLDVIKKYYIDLHKNYQWGYDYKNLIGGLYNLHPNEIDKFLSQANV